MVHQVLPEGHLQGNLNCCAAIIGKEHTRRPALAQGALEQGFRQCKAWGVCDLYSQQQQQQQQCLRVDVRPCGRQ
jgi:hypothetical protein